ncbi:MAG: FKBP-type peptidyl-prolyl cis-trans isomerase [Methanosarcinaceae archaeon]|nr:FKBP-type peptidyl-prolyl cis-trans isomerase [Methanosarcinaceae archaeon]
MAIEKGDFIKLQYTGKFDENTVFDTTNEELAKEKEIHNPRGMYGGDVVIVGLGHTIAGLDEDLVGKEVGYTGTVEIPPEKGFGSHDPKMVESISISKFQDRRAYPGMEIEINGRRGVVTTVIGRRARVDFNHPLAGKSVTYEYTIEQKLEDNAEKIKGLLALYTGIPDLMVEINDKKASIIIPPALTFNQRWLMSKGRIANEILANIDIDEIAYVEKYPEAPLPEVEAEEYSGEEE